MKDAGGNISCVYVFFSLRTTRKAKAWVVRHHHFSLTRHRKSSCSTNSCLTRNIALSRGEQNNVNGDLALGVSHLPAASRLLDEGLLQGESPVSAASHLQGASHLPAASLVSAAGPLPAAGLLPAASLLPGEGLVPGDRVIAVEGGCRVRNFKNY